MKIYLAGPFITNMTKYPIENPNLKMFENFEHPWVLESYHYFKGIKVDAFRERAAEHDLKTFFLDSGAFSMFTQGIDIDLNAYANYIKQNQDLIHVSSNVDEIGRGKEQESYDNLKTLESLGVKVQPVHHARDEDKWLVRQLEEGYDYIFLGGMVPESTPYLKAWLDRMWEKYLTNPGNSSHMK